MRIKDLLGFEGFTRELRLWRKDVYNRKKEEVELNRKAAEIRMRLCSELVGLPPKSFVKSYDKAKSSSNR